MTKKTPTEKTPVKAASLRPGLGVVSVLAAGLAGYAYLVRDDPTLGGLAMRISIILGAIWFAYPVLVTRSRTSWMLTAIGLAVLILRPRAAFVVFPVLAGWAVLSNRERR